jgi:hypothetical protein
MISNIQKSYIAGFLDGDGSIYVRAKQNQTYKYNYQIAPFIVMFQSKKNIDVLKNIQSILNLGKIRIRKDNMAELVINKLDEINYFINEIGPFIFSKKKQIELLSKIINSKKAIENKEDFGKLLELINSFKELNYSKNRIMRS